MYHIPIQLPETNPDYPTVYADKHYRVIVCRDSIQYIVQKSKGSQWHNRSYFMEWSSLRKQYNDLPLVDASPMLLSHERARETRCVGYEDEVYRLDKL